MQKGELLPLWVHVPKQHSLPTEHTARCICRQQCRSWRLVESKAWAAEEPVIWHVMVSVHHCAFLVGSLVTSRLTAKITVCFVSAFHGLTKGSRFPAKYTALTEGMNTAPRKIGRSVDNQQCTAQAGVSTFHPPSTVSLTNILGYQLADTVSVTAAHYRRLHAHRQHHRKDCQ